MDDLLTRFWTDLAGRLTGPMTFRLILQPLMATIYAVRDGLKDARDDRPPYFWALLTRPEQRGRLIREGWRATVRVITLGIVMDLIYQLIVFRRIYPFELVVVAMLLAFVPYLLMRGPIGRIARAWRNSHRVSTS
jgi:hypothetical protein